jgi:asparagine synthase (glutamine-hydrolysing)
MQAQSSRPVRTFTIGYREAQYDEADDASRVAQHLGTEHTEFRLTPAEACAVIPELPRIWDEPFADESQIPTLLVARLARQHVTVALSGDGGDESFGGYSRHFMAARLAPIFGLPLKLRRAAASALRMLGAETRDCLFRTLLPGALRRGLSGQNLQKLVQVLDIGDEHELYERLTSVGSAPVLADPVADGVDAVPPLPNLAARLMYRDMAGYLPGDILVKVDRASMAVSLEARCPLLDHRVVEFAWRLPTTIKVRNGKGKWLLRRVLRRYLPEALFERPKHGFDVPIGAWLKGPLRDWAEELLAEPRLRREGFVDADAVQGCWQEHLSGRRDRAYELWAILMVEAWLSATCNRDTKSLAAETVETAAATGASPVRQTGERTVYV